MTIKQSLTPRWPDGTTARDRDRFFSNIEPAGDCWLWTGTVDRYGYGRFPLAGHLVGSHRLSYEMFRAPIPSGLHIDHECHNRDRFCPGGTSCRHRRCVNPWHAEPVTNRVNALRGAGFSARNAAKMHCDAGHPYDEANTYRNPTTGHRECRECRRAVDRAAYDAEHQPSVRPLATEAHCAAGHQWTSANTYTRPNGQRTCRACKRIQYRVSVGLPADGPSGRKRQDACAKGHSLAGENLYVKPSGKRECRTCKRELVRARASRISMQATLQEPGNLLPQAAVAVNRSGR